MPVSVDWGKALLDWLASQHEPIAEPATPPPLEKTPPDISADLGSGGAANFDFKTFSGDLKLVK